MIRQIRRKLDANTSQIVLIPMKIVLIFIRKRIANSFQLVQMEKNASIFILISSANMEINAPAKTALTSIQKEEVKEQIPSHNQWATSCK